MKILNLEFGEALTRSQMKNIFGGVETKNAGDCQEHNDDCDTSATLNCCNGLVCADWKCRELTE